jgi:hypothetical protein
MKILTILHLISRKMSSESESVFYFFYDVHSNTFHSKQHLVMLDMAADKYADFHVKFTLFFFPLEKKLKCK